MKMLTMCFDCFKENGYPSLEFNTQDITDDGMYKVECSKGHITYQMMQNEKFEILFDLGADALNKGYKYEAIACFKASLERFYEYFIKVILTKNKVSTEDIEKTWSYVSSHSERQLGAFYFLYLQEFKEVPVKESGSKVELRNNVIHKGYIPTYKKVFDYGEYILNYIRSILEKMDNNYEEYQFKMNSYRQIELRKKYNIEDNTFSNGPLNTIINTSSRDTKHNRMSFEEALEFIKKREEGLGGVASECKGIDRKIE